MNHRSTFASILAVAVLVTLAPAQSHAGETGNYFAAAGQKLGFGALSALYSPLELIVTPVAFGLQMDRDGRSLLGVLCGIPAGAVNMSMRLAEGSRDVLTFPLTTGARDYGFSASPHVTGWNMLRVERPQAHSIPAFSPQKRSAIPSLD